MTNMLSRIAEIVVQRVGGVSSDSLLDEAESIGEVKLDSHWGGGRRCCISIGKYGEIQLKVWGEGKNSATALKEAIAKFQTLTAVADSIR